MIDFDAKILDDLTQEMKIAFDAGQIEKLYRSMYELADEIASFELERRREFETDTLFRTRSPFNARERRTEPLGRLASEFKNSRVEFHMNKMQRLLELYAAMKRAEKAAEN